VTARATTLLRRADGQAIVEFAFVLPLLLGLLLGIVQFGMVFNNYITLTDAARVGARKAAVSRFAGDSGAAAKTAASDAASGLDPSKFNVTVVSCLAGTSGPSCVSDWTTTGDEITVTATYPYSVSILDWTIKSGTLTTVTKERLE
jgi:Flp pilus assembly protein TadG